MASLSKSARGGRFIQFTDGDRQRRTIHLGDMTAKQAEALLVRVEVLITAKIAGTPIDPPTASWVREIGDVLHERIARVGLVQPRTESRVTLADMFQRYFASITVKPSTERTYRMAQAAAEQHFGKDRQIDSITAADDAEGFKKALRDAKYAQATISKWIKVVRQAFRKAVKAKLVEENPFADVRAGSQTNDARLRFIPAETIKKVIAECPDSEWRLLIALSRYGGLRCPSEHLSLRWDGVDWKRQRITVLSPKTEGNENQETRIIPLFPELVPYLKQALADAPPGAVFVISDKHRRAERNGRTPVNLGTQLQRFIRKAGLQPWPRVWHNLRASRQTELNERFPLHVVCKWLGNTTTVAAQSYLSVRPSDHAAAVKAAAEAEESALRIALQQAAELARRQQQR